MANWVTISSLATAAGTLVLAVATFGSTRSANRSTRIAEESLLAAERPLLMPTRPDDPPVKVGFMDNHWVQVPGGAATIEVTDEAIYLAISLRNAGSGIAVLDGWRLDWTPFTTELERPDPDGFRRLTRDLYIPAGQVYFWQGALRDAGDPERERLLAHLPGAERVVVDLLYGDHRGNQRMTSRFSLIPADGDRYVATVARHWNLDRPDPR
jgi:hypothetical protein